MIKHAQCQYEGCEKAADVIRTTVGGNYPMTFCATHDPLTDDSVKPYFHTPEVGP